MTDLTGLSASVQEEQAAWLVVVSGGAEINQKNMECGVCNLPCACSGLQKQNLALTAWRRS